MIPRADFNSALKVDDYLNMVDFESLNAPGGYTPSAFSIKFLNFIKLVNGEQGESHKSPVMHMAMLDKISNRTRKIANLCARGTAKTTLFMEYMVLYLAMFGVLPNFGIVTGILYVSDSMDNGVKSARNSIEFRYNNSEFLQYWLPKARFTENYIEFENRSGHKLGVKMFGAKTGIRGTKIFGKRPVLAIMDDLVSDEDAESKAAMDKIKSTVFSGIQYAMDPTRYKMILNGTPFNKNDVVYEAIESGAWDVNVWPVCEKFPCTREEFRSCWPDRFTFEYVSSVYEDAVKEGKVKNFRQELMLRITSDESRLVQDSEIKWRPRGPILARKSDYNFFITTDFATSSKQTADYSVISVWAYTTASEFFWVDGMVERQSMDKTVDRLFQFVAEYQPQSVGVEITGQQQGFIKWLLNEMVYRDKFFNLTHHNGEPGIRPATDKLSRFNMIVPQFKAGKIIFPEELMKTREVGLFMEQISLATRDGIKGKDDCLDTISMLQYMSPWASAPLDSGQNGMTPSDMSDPMWGSNDLTPRDLDDSGFSSYTV